MGIFRSEKMACKRICFPQEYSDQVLEELGRIENGAEIIDINQDVMESRRENYIPINRCKEIEKKICKIEKICEEFDFEIKKYGDIKKFYKDCQTDIDSYRNFQSSYFDNIENQIYEDEKQLDELILYKNQLISDIQENHEKFYSLKNLLKSLDVIEGKGPKVNLKEYRSDYSISDDNNLNSYLLEEGHYEDNSLYICGIVRAEEKMKFQRMVFRASFDRCNFKFMDIPNIKQKYIVDLEVNKSKPKHELKQLNGKKAFVIFIEDVSFKKKITKICSVMDIKLYDVPQLNKIKEAMRDIKTHIGQSSKLLKEVNINILDLLNKRIGEGEDSSKYAMYKLYFRKEKYKLNALNKCTHLGNIYEARICIPEKKINLLTNKLKEMSDKYHYSVLIENLPVPEGFVYPTFFELNDFTFPFQEIVNTYGYARYQEINPSLFNIVTFPFLFGVMFGDIGHGLLLFLLGSYLVYKNDSISKSNSEVLKGFSKARYLLFLMGASAFYCGFMYNDFLSIPLNFFGSCYTNSEIDNKAVRSDKDCVYPIGLDPKWFVASNELAFFNSLKMKLSVIFGVIHMLGGILLRGLNAIYFKSKMDFFFEFIPQIIFMTLLFGYMIVMIFIKWATDWTTNSENAPSIISALMNIFLKGGSVDGKPLFSLSDPSFQETLQFYFLIIALICLPILLIPKPIMTYFKHKKEEEHKQHLYSNEKNIQNAKNLRNKEQAAIITESSEKRHSNDEHGFGDLFVHQAIETIEFTLGSISNTASYLRLWALSLAHAQLAKVFFEKSLLGFIHQGSLILVIIGFFIFANITFFVLMCMDLMECFLHTLRLHWVEFQNKFFKADGRKFNPYDFSTLLE